MYWIEKGRPRWYFVPNSEPRIDDPMILPGQKVEEVVVNESWHPVHTYRVVGDLVIQLLIGESKRCFTLGQTVYGGGQYRDPDGWYRTRQGLPSEFTTGHIVGFSPPPCQFKDIIHVMFAPHLGMVFQYKIISVRPEDLARPFDCIV